MGSASWRTGFVASTSPKANHVLVKALEFVPCTASKPVTWLK